MRSNQWITKQQPHFAVQTKALARPDSSRYWEQKTPEPCFLVQC